MGTLAGQKVKDVYGSLLKIDSGNASTTTKTIEDGIGTDTALKLGTTAVEVNGELRFTNAPITGGAATTALFFDGTKVVKRDLGSNAFTSSNTSYTADSPLTLTSTTFGVNNPANLEQSTSETLSSVDGFLVYDATSAVYKGLTVNELLGYVNVNGAPALPAGSTTQVQFNNAGVFGASSLLTMSTGVGTEQLYFGGLELIVRETSGGNSAIYRRAVSASIPTATTNQVVFSPNWANFKGVKVEYVLYNATEEVKRQGQLNIIWNSVAGSTATMTETVHVSYGASTTATFVFNVTIVGSQVQLRATNTNGQTLQLRMDCKLFYSY
jgi:hypothetical protein